MDMVLRVKGVGRRQLDAVTGRNVACPEARYKKYMSVGGIDFSGVRICSISGRQRACTAVGSFMCGRLDHVNDPQSEVAPCHEWQNVSSMSNEQDK
jgi:hypothetical protein